MLSCCLTQLKAIAQLGLKWQTVEGGAYFLVSVLLVVEITWQVSFPSLGGKVANVWTTIPHYLTQCFLHISVYVSTDILYRWIFFLVHVSQSSLVWNNPPSLVSFSMCTRTNWFFYKRNGYFQCFPKGSNLFPLFKRDVWDMCNQILVDSSYRCIVWALWVCVCVCAHSIYRVRTLGYKLHSGKKVYVYRSSQVDCKLFSTLSCFNLLLGFYVFVCLISRRHYAEFQIMWNNLNVNLGFIFQTFSLIIYMQTHMHIYTYISIAYFLCIFTNFIYIYISQCIDWNYFWGG